MKKLFSVRFVGQPKDDIKYFRAMNILALVIYLCDNNLRWKIKQIKQLKRIYRKTDIIWEV